jgi:hypothetical protein
MVSEPIRRAEETKHLSEEADRRRAKLEHIDAYQQGLFVIRQSGDTVAIANNATFRPTAW